MIEGTHVTVTTDTIAYRRVIVATDILDGTSLRIIFNAPLTINVLSRVMEPNGTAELTGLTICDVEQVEGKTVSKGQTCVDAKFQRDERSSEVDFEITFFDK